MNDRGDNPAAIDRAVDRRSDARIVRSALDEVKAIQTLLADVYKDAGDGRTLLRELVQNADDAGAKRLVLAVLEWGWPEARNSLLRGPALLVANDGSFPAGDRDALHQALGGSKADDAGKVGTFGIGLKSVFHICEAIVYVGAEGGVLRPGALNPWAGTGELGDADPLHPDWDIVDDDDLERLLGVARQLLGGFDDGLVQWIPLRRAAHLDRAEDRQYGLGQVCPAPEEVATWFGRRASLALLLAQSGHLISIEADRAVAPDTLNAGTQLARVVRPAFEDAGWVGRHDDDAPAPDRTFEGTIEDGERRLSVLGVEALGLDSLRRLRSEAGWPNDPHWRDGRSVWVPRKALAHAAVTVLRPDGALAERCGARLRWAVFLPLDDGRDPHSSAVVETVGRASSTDAWDIVMHGYFWPSHDRRSIPGVTDDDAGAGDSAVRIRWNRAVRDDLLLPLLPSVLANAVIGVPEGVARELLGAVADSLTVQAHLAAVTQRHLLLPVVAGDGVRWEARDITAVRVLSVPAWTRAPSTVRTLFTMRRSERAENVVFIDADAPRLGGEPDEWPVDWLECLLRCVPADVLGSSQELSWIDALVHHVLGAQVSGEDERAAAVARWLAERIGEGALAPTIEGSFTDEQEEVRDAWRRLFAALPEPWLVDAPVESQRAVVELAAEGVVGEGLLPIPLGRHPNEAHASRPDPERLDHALLELGRRLTETEGTSQRAQRSRLLLAETLLSVRDDRPLGEDLGSLPLLRARRLPDDRDEAWSVGELRRQSKRLRVFARPSAADGNEGSTLESPADPKRAVRDLAEALGEDVWLVDDAVASTEGARGPTPDALALAVLHGEAIQSDPAQRISLLRRLAEDATDSTVHLALRTVLTGRVAGVGEESELFYVRSQDSERDENRKTLEILLCLLDRSWCAVEPELVERLPHAIVDDLHVKAIDVGLLHRLLDESLDKSIDWTQLETAEALHLLRRLFGTAREDRARWRAMPLHRGVGGDRRTFDDRAVRAAGELRLPPELEEEIRLLDPDPEVADLYQDVPALDDDGILHAMLVSARPQQFAERIVRALRSGEEGRVALPRDPKLLDLLKSSTWLPHREDDSGLAPKSLLVIPQELRADVVPLAASGALGDHRLPEAVAPAVWSTAENVVREILGRPRRTRQIQRLGGALNPAQVAQVDGGAYLILPEPELIDASLVEDALEAPLAGSHPGWALVRTAARVAEVGRGTLDDAPSAARDAVLAIARSLCAPVPAARQVSVLTTIAASRPLKVSPAGRVFHRLVECFTDTDGFFDHVLPYIELPTEDGQWHRAHEVARSASGVARRHRLMADLRSSLQLDSEEPVREETRDDVTIGSGTADALAKYFESWADRLPHGAVGAFLGLLGDGRDGAIARLSEEWLGDDVSVEGMRRSVNAASGGDSCATVRVFVSGRVARGKRVEAVNVLGERVEMEAGFDDETVFATDPVRRYSVRGDFWEISLRDVEPQRRTAHELMTLLGGTVEWWAIRILRFDRQKVRTWWSRWGTGSQAQVGPVQASILAHLPLTLHQLDVRECEALRDALRQAQRAQRKREQAPPTQIRDAMDTERAALDELACLIRDDREHRDFLWGRVQELMQRFGYRADSVLLELAQNADDALAQAAEIAGSPLPPAARRLVVRVHEHDGVPTVDITHYGRPINDTGGASFPAGRDRQWDQDLYFMMLLNLSGKPGEVAGQTAASSTTGRFGLGFKSVHLVSPAPSVVSGFLAFSIAGGLLPQEQPVPDESELLPAQGHRATRVRLPLRGDVEASDLIENLFGRFGYARTLLPAFARHLREVVVDGGPCSGVSVFDGEPVDGAPGWSIAAEMAELPGHGRLRIVRFRPADAGTGAGTAALVFGLRDGVPTPFPSDLPFLWNVTPTSEGWGCGYAVNGPFKLDPGRTHVSLDDDATLRVVNLLGEALGKGLVELHDALVDMKAGTAFGLSAASDAQAFLASLWTVLASGIDNRDELRRELLLRLHGPGRGLSVWMAARAVVPSDLPAPFPERLPPLNPDMQIEVAVDGLDDPALCRAFAKVDDVASLVGGHRVVSGEVAQRLRPLVRTPIRQLQPSDILAELAERWDQVLTPARLHALRPFAEDAVWTVIPSDSHSAPWHSRLVARSEDGTSAPLRDLLLPRELDLPEADVAVEDELRRAAFAPEARILAPAYIAEAEDLTMFLRLRVRHQVGAATMAEWYAVLPLHRRPAALRYLLHGGLQHDVLQRLVPLEMRPPWLKECDDVRRMLEDLGEDRWRCQALLAALFPNQFEDGAGPPPEPILPELVRHTFFERLQEWWNDADQRRDIIESYEAKAWPDWLRREGIADGLRAESDEHWLGLLVLGACQGIGLAHDGHHRRFLESAHREGWWEVFKTPDDTSPWMDVLRTWQDRAVADLEHSRWMSLFPAIYQLSRYLKTYRTLLITAGRRPAEFYRVTCLLAPRVDEALTGAGQQFDAPPAPLNMGLHWILRELVRLRVLDGDHILPDCWVPSEQVLRFLRPLGLETAEDSGSNSEKARAIFAFLACELGTSTPHLHRSFDIPLRYVDADADLRRRLGLED